MYGYTHEEFIRLKNTDLSAEPEKTQNTTNTPQQNIPLRYHIRKDGGVFPVEISANTLILQGVTFLLVTIRDISRHRYTEEMLGEANQKLSLLTDLTMHDISNHLTTIKLCQEKALASSDPTIVTEYIAMAQEGVSQMEATIGFTCEYENFQAISSGWQQVHMIIESSKSEVALGSVKVNNQIPDDLDVYADPIIRKAFTTILENAIRHGECITGILISCLEVDKNMIITCEDDGVGILAEEKEQIFEHGYGKNTGIGLFLAREILSITGISIRECGVFGKGAKFEISVPEGAYRLDARILTDTKGTQ
jgi:signal transduction histidine kinase